MSAPDSNREWAAARRAAKRRRLIRESRTDAGRTRARIDDGTDPNDYPALRRAVGSTTDLPFPAQVNSLRQLEQARLRRIAEARPDHKFCAGVLDQVRAGRPITSRQAFRLLAIEHEHPEQPGRPRPAARTETETVTCPKCGAPPGRPCTGRDGPRHSHHLERHRTYLSAKSTG